MTNSPACGPLGALFSEEHTLLLRAAALFARYARRVASGKRHDPRLAYRFLRLFRTVLEAHGEAEEGQLFPWLASRGLPGDAGPLLVLRLEHELIREARLELERASRALVRSPRSPAARLRFHGRGLRYVELLMAHIAKEERALYPLVRRLAANEDGGARRGVVLARERAWIDALEEGPLRSWPAAELSLHGLGSPRGFRRLCRAYLPDGRGGARGVLTPRSRRPRARPAR